MNLSSFTMKVLAASLIIASTTGVALAKNYKGENYKAEAVPCPAPRMLMSGFYVGGQVGYDSYRVRTDIDALDDIVALDPVQNATGWVGGLYLGWGMYLNDWFYLGAEVDGNWTGAQTDFEHTALDDFYENEFAVRGQWGVSLLPGFRLNDTSLGYVRLGWNWARLRVEEEFSDFPFFFEDEDTHTANGFVFGVGIETLLVDNWSVRAEFNHTYYSNIEGDFVLADTDWKPSDNQFMVGLSYHFG